jgi:hypothetical protein
MSQGSPRRTSSARSDRQPPRRYRDLERVQLRRDLPEHGLKRGERGTITHVFDAANAYLVEFVNPEDGSTRAEIEVNIEDIAPARPARVG